MSPSATGAPRDRSGARRPALAAIALGLLLLGAAAGFAGRSGPPPDAGAARAAALAGAAPSAGPPGAVIPVAPGALPSPTAAVAPARLRITSIAVDAKVNAVAVDMTTNQFEVPPSVDEVGWYRFGPGLDADAGSVVIAGHVDGAKQGAGAFFRLRNLAPGASVEVTGTDGRSHAFRVVARETYPKSAIPLRRYFARDGTLRLTLITCGGPFVAKTRSYRDNVVITAEPVAP